MSKSDIEKESIKKGELVKWYLTDPHGDLVINAGTGIVISVVEFKPDNRCSHMTKKLNHKWRSHYKVYCTDLNKTLWFAGEHIELIESKET